ncbi:MAG: glycosyltransferase [Fimbriiglobus sp.]
MMVLGSAALRVVLVHDWLTGMRGGEKCLEVACQRFPEAPLLVLFHVAGSVSPEIESHHPRASWLNRLPGVSKRYRYLLPLFPFVASFRAQDCDLVLSFSHCVAKSTHAPQGRPHVCYCFTPMRYAWHLSDAYFAKGGLAWVKSRVMRLALAPMRAWDRATARRVTHFIAISRTIQTRIRECYGRESVVIYPPVDTEYYTPSEAPREDFYLVVSALAPYKRFDLAIEACERLGRKLVIIGSGQEEAKLRRRAGGNVTFLGRQPDEVLRDHYQRCRALLFPAEEDFGIVPLEAQACGAPVIALARGGSTETLLPETAEFFETQTVEAVQAAILAFEGRPPISPLAARQNAERFTKARYERELMAYLDQVNDGLA